MLHFHKWKYVGHTLFNKFLWRAHGYGVPKEKSIVGFETHVSYECSVCHKLKVTIIDGVFTKLTNE